MAGRRKPVEDDADLELHRTDHRIEPEMVGRNPDEHDRLFMAFELLEQILRHLVDRLRRETDERVETRPRIKQRLVLPMADRHHLRQPPLMLGRLARVHHEIRILRRGPGRHHDSKLPLHLMLRNLARHECADPRDPLQILLLDQRSDRLADRHVARIQPLRQLALRRQHRTARKVSHLNLPQQMLADIRRLAAVGSLFHR